MNWKKFSAKLKLLRGIRFKCSWPLHICLRCAPFYGDSQTYGIYAASERSKIWEVLGKVLRGGSDRELSNIRCFWLWLDLNPSPSIRYREQMHSSLRHDCTKNWITLTIIESLLICFLIIFISSFHQFFAKICKIRLLEIIISQIGTHITLTWGNFEKC